jgi:hypothetical protein
MPETPDIGTEYNHALVLLRKRAGEGMTITEFSKAAGVAHLSQLAFWHQSS